MHQVRLEEDANASVVVLVAEGELDLYTEPLLRGAVEQAELDGDRNVVIDLSAVSFLDSTALGVVVKAVRRAGERGRDVRVVLPGSTARRIFEITTLDRVLPVAASRAEAVEELDA